MNGRFRASGHEKKFSRRVRTERILALIAVLTIIVAAILGAGSEKGIVITELKEFVPDGYVMVSVNEQSFAVSSAGSPDDTEFYLSAVRTKGYGGAIEVVILVDTAGVILGADVLSHKETPTYMKRIRKENLLEQLRGKSYADSIRGGTDIDVVSGATYSSYAIISAARIVCRNIAGEQLHFSVPAPPKEKITFELAEISLLLLLLSALVALFLEGRPKKILHWLVWLSSLTILGFWLAVPLSLVKINSMLMAYFPDWRTGIYWYLLLAGFIAPILFTGKNIYCNRVCPFGGLQECLGVIGGARYKFSRRWITYLNWFQRVLAWMAICLALLFQNPVQVNYQVFGVAFTLSGAYYLFAILFLFIIAALFTRRPYCSALCPINAIADLLRLTRNWILELFRISSGSDRAHAA